MDWMVSMGAATNLGKAPSTPVHVDEDGWMGGWAQVWVGVCMWYHCYVLRTYVYLCLCVCACVATLVWYLLQLCRASTDVVLASTLFFSPASLLAGVPLAEAFWELAAVLGPYF
jgi:hypothetical protein